jgi:hypothetical protein
MMKAPSRNTKNETLSKVSYQALPAQMRDLSLRQRGPFRLEEYSSPDPLTLRVTRVLAAKISTKKKGISKWNARFIGRTRKTTSE